MGRVFAKGTIHRLLCGRLQVVDHLKRHPEVEEERIERPVFILGLPRSGTTILHALLAIDPAHRSPLSWEAILPWPPPRPGTYDTDPRIEKVERELRQLDRLSPGFDAAHYTAATLPQECIALTAFEFVSVMFVIQFTVPGYLAWYQEQPAPYAAHRRWLQYLQSGGVRAERWLLKTPAHLAHLEELLEHYPDARIVHTHREPIDVVASVASLACLLRRLTSDHIDPVDVGREMVTWWERDMRSAVEARDRLTDREHQIVDLPMAELVRDPIGAVERLYGRFGFELRDDVRDRMKRFMDENPRDRHGQHRYSPSEFGIDPGQDGERFQFYRDRFDVQGRTEDD